MRSLRKYPNGGDIKNNGELPQINLTASRANWEKQKKLRAQLAKSQQEYNNLIADYGLTSEDQSQFGYQPYQGGMSSVEELQAKINKLEESYKNTQDQFASANRALANLKTAYPDEWENKTVSDVVTPAGLSAMRRLKTENNAYDFSLRDYYSNYGHLVDPNTQRGYGPGATWSQKEAKENWMEDPTDFINMVNKGVQYGLGLAGAGATGLASRAAGATSLIGKAAPYATAPLTIGSRTFPLINPINTIGLGFGAYSAGNLANSESVSRQSLSKAYENPTAENILDATGNVTMDALGVLTSPGMGNLLVKAGQGIANTPKAIGNLYEDVATGGYSAIPYAWKNPAAALDAEQSTAMFDKIMQADNFTPAEKAMLKEYQYDNSAFVTPGPKQDAFNALIKKAEVTFPKNTVVTRAFTPTSLEGYTGTADDIRTISMQNRPSAFSAGVSQKRKYYYDNQDRIVLAGRNLKKVEGNFAKQNYNPIEEGYYTGIPEENLTINYRGPKTNKYRNAFDQEVGDHYYGTSRMTPEEVSAEAEAIYNNRVAEFNDPSKANSFAPSKVDELVNAGYTQKEAEELAAYQTRIFNEQKNLYGDPANKQQALEKIINNSKGFSETAGPKEELELFGSGFDMKVVRKFPNKHGGFDYVVQPKNIKGVNNNPYENLIKTASNYLTTQTPLRNAYKINPWALKENPEMFLYRARPIGQNPDMNMAAQIRAKELAGEPLTWFQKNLLNPQTNPQILAREKYYGQWFEKDPSRLSFYIDPGTRNFADNDAIEILRTRLPKSEASKLNVSQFDDAKILSSSPKTEFILPKDMINKAEKFPESNWQQLIQEDKAFNTPHWLRGYKPIETPNKQVSYNLKAHSTSNNPNIRVANIDGKRIPLNTTTRETLQDEYISNLKAYYDSPEFKRIMREHYPDIDIEAYKATTLENLQKELTFGNPGEKATGAYFHKNSSGVTYPSGYTPSFAERVANANTNPDMYSGRAGTSIVSDTGSTWHELGHQRTNAEELLPDFLTEKYLKQNTDRLNNLFYDADDIEYLANPSEFEVRLKQLKEDLKTEGIANYFEKPITAEDIKKSSAFRLQQTHKDMISQMKDVRSRMKKLGASSEDLELLNKTFNSDVGKLNQTIKPYSTETEQLLRNWSPSFLAKMAGRIPLTIPGVIGGGFLANQQLNKTYKSGGSLAPNIPTYYNFKGTPIYRDTTSLPFASGGMLDGPPDNPVLPSLKNLNTNEVSALLYNTVAKIIERKKAEGKIRPGENLDLRGVVAQILLESGNAKSGLTAKYNNFGGLKATQGFIDRGGKTVAMTNKATGKKFLWRAYDTPEQGLEAQIDFLLDNPRYRKAGIFNAKNTQEYLAAVSKAGYAGGESSYARKVNQMARSLDKRLKKVTPEKLQELNQTYNVSPTLQPIGTNTIAPINQQGLVNQTAVSPQVQAPVIDPAILSMRENLVVPSKSSIDLLKQPISQLEEMPAMGSEINPPSFVPDEGYYMSGLPTPEFRSRVVPFMGKGASNYQTSGGLRLPYVSGWNQNQFINPIARRTQQQTGYDPDYYYGTDETPGEYEKASLENRPINFEGGFASKKMQRDAEQYLQEYDQYNQLLQDSENYGNLMLGRQFKYGSNLYERQGLIPSMYASSLGRYYGNGGKIDYSMYDLFQHGTYSNGGMIKRADGSYSQRGLWDNIQANAGSGKKPTKEMLAQERKINNQKANGGYLSSFKASNIQTY